MNNTKKKENPITAFFGAIGKFVKEFGQSVKEGDSGVKASLLLMGAGYWKRGQKLKGVLVTLLEIAVVLYNVFIGFLQHFFVVCFTSDAAFYIM